MRQSVRSHFVLAAAAAAILMPSLGHAGAKIVDPINDTKFTVLRGAVESNQNGNVDPWVAQVYSGGGECVRIAITRQGADLTGTLISPDGTVWFDDDSGGSLRPLIRARTSARGWYPLVISTYGGFTATSDFEINYGRFPISSAQCAGASDPLLAPAADKAPSGTGN